VSEELPTLCAPPAVDFPKLQSKSQPEDFIVEELPLYEPSGAGTHAYFFVEKRQLNTLDAARRIAHFFKKRPADAGIAGLKDAQAITRQWISLEHVPDAQRAMEISDAQLKVLAVSAHGNKLKMGHLKGNRFVIRLRPDMRLTNEQQTAVGARAKEVLAKLQKTGVPNYFGEQRFGRYGDNAELGRKLVQGDKAGFDELFSKSGSRRPPDRRLRNLLVNAFQAELFNQVLARRMPEIYRIQAGDLAQLHRNGAVFAVASDADSTREQPRADAFEISPSGPMFGPKMPRPTGVPGEIEAAVLAECGVSCEDFGRDEAERQPGARRPLRIPLLEAPEAKVDEAGLELRFALPPGAYASVVIRELLWKPDA